MKLLSACEKAKKNLSPQGVNSTNLNIECLIEEYDYHSKITLEEFETMVAPLLNRLEEPIVAALADAGITKENLSCIEIVGGGTRVASVKRKLADILGLDTDKPNLGLSTTLNADESVARGCALQCAILSPLFKVKDFAIADIVGFPVRVSWEKCEVSAAQDTNDENGNDDEVALDANSSENSVLILTRKDEFPKTKRITFRRAEAFSIDANYDESADAFLPTNTEKFIGKFTITGIPPLEAGAEVPRIRVNVRQDIHGLFEVASSQLMSEIKEEEKPAEVEEGKEAADKPVEPKKKRFRKQDLKVESSVGGLSAADVSSATEEELQMAQQDRVIEETANKRNELESFVYDFRNQLGDKYSEFVLSSDRSAIEDTLNEYEDWLYSDEGFDSTKSVYQGKLDELRKLSNPIESRYQESTERPVATAELKTVIEDYKRMANSSDDAYSHWSDEDCNKLRKACSDAETWLFDQLSAQANVKANQAPVVTAAAIRNKIVEVRSIALPIVTKPKPLPKVEPPAAPTATATGDDTKEDDKMDLD